MRIVTQPIVDLVTGRIAGYKALARFDHSARSPQDWFAVAHRQGLGAALEAAVVDAALSLPARPAGTYLSLNVSPSTLGTRELGEVLPYDLTGLVFELTENEPISADPTLPSTIRSYRRRGACFALDDIGAGCSRLDDAHLIAPELIKLDRTLIAGAELDPVRAASLESLVHAAAATGAAVCGEGVETLAQLRRLHRGGVTCAQGYLLGRPAPGWASYSADLDTVVRRIKTPTLFDRHDLPRPRRRRPGTLTFARNQLW